MISAAGLISAPLITSYSASKAGARAFTDALRREVVPLGIKVSGIYPGPAATEFGQHVGGNKLGPINIDVRYIFGLTDIFDGSSDIQVTNSSLGAGVSFMF